MGFRVGTLLPDDPPDSFPDPAEADIALGYPDGLIAIGGDLSVARLLQAYKHGIFPWYNEDQPILWWSPDPRAVILPQNFRMSRSLRRELRRGGWQYSVNQRFNEVIRGCGRDRGEHGTWITPDMETAFIEMHREGYSHSIESWHDGQLAGGLYGVRLGAVFYAESMYSARTSASKVALAALVWLALQEPISLIDCQLESDHLGTLGMQPVARSDFLQALPELTRDAAPLPDWNLTPRSGTELAALRPPATC